MKTLLPLSVIILLIAGGVGFLLFWPTNSKKADTTIPAPTQTTNPATKSMPPDVQGIPAIKAYAALQFNIQPDEVTVVKSEEQEWDDICLGISIPDYDCTKQKVTGYEVTVEIDGNQTTYRGSEDGSIIRIVKIPSAEDSPSEAPSPEE